VYTNEWCNSQSGQMHGQDWHDELELRQALLSSVSIAGQAMADWLVRTKKVSMNIGGGGSTDNCLDIDITGQADYDVGLDQTIHDDEQGFGPGPANSTLPSGNDLFLLYNKRTGINICHKKDIILEERNFAGTFCFDT
jgi:hypothetical protein